MVVQDKWRQHWIIREFNVAISYYTTYDWPTVLHASMLESVREALKPWAKRPNIFEFNTARCFSDCIFFAWKKKFVYRLIFLALIEDMAGQNTNRNNSKSSTAVRQSFTGIYSILYLRPQYLLDQSQADSQFPLTIGKQYLLEEGNIVAEVFNASRTRQRSGDSAKGLK